MKNQYTADVNDFRKYGLLRGLSAGGGLDVFVAWMLTADDFSGDGMKRSYLRNAERFRDHDAELYDGLLRISGLKRPAVRHVEGSGLLGGAKFHNAVLGDEAAGRRRWFEALYRKAEGFRCLFFDPDNGFEVRSVRKGARGSSKYLYWDEFEEAWRRGFSLIVYQHYPRVQREPWRRALCERVGEHAPGCAVATASTSHVVFVAAVQEEHAERMKMGLEDVKVKWRGEMEVEIKDEG